MIRNTIYLIATSITWLLLACQDITIGYLESDAAKYTIDTLHIVANAKSELQRLKVIEIDFYSATSTLQDKIAGLEEELDELQDKLDGSDEYWDAYDELGGTDIEEQFWNDEISFEEYTRLIDQINKELDDTWKVCFGTARPSLICSSNGSNLNQKSNRQLSIPSFASAGREYSNLPTKTRQKPATAPIRLKKSLDSPLSQEISLVEFHQ